MKSVKVTSLVLLVGLTCIGLALVAGAPGQQAASTDASAGTRSASGVPAPSSAGTQPTPDGNIRRGTSATPAISRSANAAVAADELFTLQPPQPAKAADPFFGSSVNGAYAPAGYPPAADPEVGKWMVEARKAEAEQEQLLAKYAQTTDQKQRAEIKASLAKVLERQFDLQLQQREREVSAIEARVKKLREMIDKRSKARQTIVTGRLDQLLNEMDGMGWAAPTGPSSRGGRLRSTFPQRSAGEATPSTPATRSAAPLPSAR